MYRQTGELTSKSDIFSFGIVLLELFTRRKQPVPDSNWLLQDFLDAYRNNQVIQLVDPEIAIAENMELLHSITEIIVHCLNPDIDQRPEMRFFFLNKRFPQLYYHKANKFKHPKNSLIHKGQR